MLVAIRQGFHAAQFVPPFSTMLMPYCDAGVLDASVRDANVTKSSYSVVNSESKADSPKLTSRQSDANSRLERARLAEGRIAARGASFYS